MKNNVLLFRHWKTSITSAEKPRRERREPGGRLHLPLLKTRLGTHYAGMDGKAPQGHNGLCQREEIYRLVLRKKIIAFGGVGGRVYSSRPLSRSSIRSRPIRLGPMYSFPSSDSFAPQVSGFFLGKVVWSSTMKRPRLCVHDDCSPVGTHLPHSLPVLGLHLHRLSFRFINSPARIRIDEFHDLKEFLGAVEACAVDQYIRIFLKNEVTIFEIASII